MQAFLIELGHWQMVILYMNINKQRELFFLKEMIKYEESI